MRPLELSRNWTKRFTGEAGCQWKMGLLRIGFISTAGSEIVPDIFRQFRELNPEVEFSLRAITTADQVQMWKPDPSTLDFFVCDW